jgi:hypothetical protein
MTVEERLQRHIDRKAALPGDPLFEGCLTVEELTAVLPTSFRQLAEDEVAKRVRDAEGTF